MTYSRTLASFGRILILIGGIDILAFLGVTMFMVITNNQDPIGNWVLMPLSGIILVGVGSLLACSRAILDWIKDGW
jgi:hypothetical protein